MVVLPSFVVGYAILDGRGITVVPGGGVITLLARGLVADNLLSWPDPEGFVDFA